MNKYQEPLDCIKRFYAESEHYDEEDINLLQELVDKATPKKIVIKKYGVFNVGDYYCPHCNNKINEEFEPKYCMHCGQALDWSDEDDK